MTTLAQSRIRRASFADRPAVQALLQSVGLPTEDLSSARELTLWVLESDGALIGTVGLERFGSAGLLRSLVVASQHRRRGLGRELVARLELEARDVGLERLVLLTETAEYFFRALGYGVTDRERVDTAVHQSAQFRFLCPLSAVCLTKSLHIAS